MNEDFISQDPSTLALLFQEGVYLVNPPKMEPNLPEEDIAKWPVEGKFSNGILFIIERQNDVADGESLQLLEKSMVGLGIDMNECGIVWLDSLNGHQIDQAYRNLQPKKIIFFGKMEGSNALQKNQASTHKNATVLYCDFLNNIARQQASKVSWWNSFKPFLLQP